MNTITFKLFEDKVSINLTLFKNCLQCVISDTEKLGSFLMAECEKIGDDMNIYDVKTKFGARDIEEYEFIARKLIEEMHNSQKIVEAMQKKYNTQEKQFNIFLGKKLGLFISLIQKENMQRNKQIVEAIAENLVNLL